MRLTLLLALCAACAPLTEAERDARAYRRAVDDQNWYACAAITTTKVCDHGHPKGEPGRNARLDLIRWQCKQRLGIYWTEY